MNPFTQRARITDPAYFTGRWREVSQVFERIERRRPAMVCGPPGIGKSSLITHIAQSAGAVLEIPDLLAWYLDLALLPDATTVYRLLIRELGAAGSNEADLEAALGRARRTVLVCLDGAEAAVAAGWGADLLERLARIARRSVPTYPGGLASPGEGSHDLLLVAAAGGAAPGLSEPFGTIGLGAVSPAEVRLFTEAYLDETGVSFSPSELRELAALSNGHPAYLQRAAFHLFEAHTRPGYGWRAAYLREAQERPVPGAPLPPAIFAGEEADPEDSSFGELAEGEAPRPRRQAMEIAEPGSLIAAGLPLVLALFVLALGAGWPIALAVLIGGYGVVALVVRRQG